MKVATYVLNPDGSVPDYVIDGGYFAMLNSNFSPQDLDLIGVVSDDAEVVPFESLHDFVTYLKSIGADSWIDSDGAVFDYMTQASSLWDQASLS